MQRPAEKLAASIQRMIDRRVGDTCTISFHTAWKWLKLAKSIDARMRLDGSPRSKQKKVKSHV